MDLFPCRSCGNCEEESCDIRIGTFSFTCKADCKPKPGSSYSIYGVDNEVKGKAICESYHHVGFDW